MQYMLKQMSIGEILDQSIKLVRQHFKELFTIVAILYGPFLLVLTVLSIRMQEAALEMQQRAPSGMAMENASAVFGQTMILMGVSVLTLIIAYPLANAAVITAIANQYLGKPVSIGTAIRRSFHLVMPLILTFILAYIMIGLGFMLLIVPGVILLFRYILLTQVVVIEDTGYWNALKRSSRLMKGNAGTVFVLGLLVAVISGSLSAIAQIIPVQMIAMVVAVLIKLATFVFGAATMVVLYFSARCQHENFDVQMLAEQLQQTAAETSVNYAAVD